jgi:ribosomal protein S18 acetylase RimI-like enzyme
VSRGKFEEIGPGLYQRDLPRALLLAELVRSAVKCLYGLFPQLESDLLRILSQQIASPEYEFANMIVLEEEVPIALVSGTKMSALQLAQMAAMTSYLKAVQPVAKAAFIAAMRRYSASLEPITSKEGYYISRVAVTPSRRGEGVGRRIMSEYLSRLPRFPVHLHVHRENIPALALYRSLGFACQTRQGRFPFLALTRETPDRANVE